MGACAGSMLSMPPNVLSMHANSGVLTAESKTETVTVKTAGFTRQQGSKQAAQVGSLSYLIPKIPPVARKCCGQQILVKIMSGLPS
ncbi:hypothetical protein DSO57_1039398 [Entomophthora muscae]|uniref:Uncharacterized protein n=1 Tax=Entomophthora muscae TaxID=34485 RepID=A0ACC2RD77_9FUNG|nr:hypothetical protein DSO57_1039398 [Entomophthora muscae]